MADFPTLSSGAVSMYPVTVATRQLTTVVEFVNGSEQRWRARPALAEFVLSYVDVEGYDLGLVLDFFLSQKGRFMDAGLTNAFSLTLPINGTPVAYHYLVFDQDDLSPVETKADRFNFTVKLKQVRRA